MGELSSQEFCGGGFCKRLDKQRAFLEFVLSHYVSQGVGELDQTQLAPLLRLRYHDSMHDAFADLGQPEQIKEVFAGFQRYLYVQS